MEQQKVKYITKIKYNRRSKVLGAHNRRGTEIEIAREK